MNESSGKRRNIAITCGIPVIRRSNGSSSVLLLLLLLRFADVIIVLSPLFHRSVIFFSKRVRERSHIIRYICAVIKSDFLADKDLADSIC